MDRPAPSTPGAAPLRRLLNPRQIAVVGGEEAAEVLRQCRLMGFAGPLWPVHPTRETMAGLPCFRSVADLPEPPDAAFVGVPRAASVEVVADLAGRGAGGAVCYASGFAEAGGEGVDWQRRLVEAAGGMALIGPNCYGVLNYLDGAALWPDSHGGQRVDRGVAIVTQSGNIGLNLTMQRRGLPVAYLVSGGNLAVTGMHEIVEALLDDPRVTAIGLHIEGLADVAAFARVAVTRPAAANPGHRAEGRQFRGGGPDDDEPHQFAGRAGRLVRRAVRPGRHRPGAGPRHPAGGPGAAATCTARCQACGSPRPVARAATRPWSRTSPRGAG